ncbi:hypothetical protein Tco_0809969 [Tanacetum coccineum]
MEDPDITMEEYIRLEEEKARRHGRDFNWETTTYSKVSYFDDINLFKDFKEEFPAIVFKDVSIPKPKSPCKLTILKVVTTRSISEFPRRILLSIQ